MLKHTYSTRLKCENVLYSVVVTKVLQCYNFTWCHIVSRSVTQCHAASRSVTQRHAVSRSSRSVTQLHAASHSVTQRHIMSGDHRMILYFLRVQNTWRDSSIPVPWSHRSSQSVHSCGFRHPLLYLVLLVSSSCIGVINILQFSHDPVLNKDAIKIQTLLKKLRRILWLGTLILKWL